MILVTGATGFIGKELTQNLLSKGHKVKVLCRDEEKAKEIFPKADVFRGDLSQPETLKSAAKGVETVVHLAGMVSYSRPREEIFSANVETTRNLLAECRNVKRIVFSSSVSVYGEVREKADEYYPLGPANAYGQSKLECERLIESSGIPYIMLRIAPIYGKGSPSWGKNLRLLEKGFPVPKTKNLTHVVHISDVVQALEKSVKAGRDRKGIYNIAGSRPLPFVSFAEDIMKLLGKKPRRMPMFVVKGIAKGMGMGAYFDVLTMNRNYVIRKAGKDLGYAPKAEFKKKLKEMVEWYMAL